MTVYCTSCGQPCDIDDGSVEPHLMRGAHYKPFAPASDCCGAEFSEEKPEEVMTVYILIERNALGMQRTLRVYTSAAAAFLALEQHQHESDGRHWYHVDKAEMENAA